MVGIVAKILQHCRLRIADEPESRESERARVVLLGSDGAVDATQSLAGPTTRCPWR